MFLYSLGISLSELHTLLNVKTIVKSSHNPLKRRENGQSTKMKEGKRGGSCE